MIKYTHSERETWKMIAYYFQRQKKIEQGALGIIDTLINCVELFEEKDKTTKKIAQ